MHAHKTHVTVTEDHELHLSLPPDFPPGVAEVIVLSTRHRPALIPERIEQLDAWIASLPGVPTLPLDALNREDIYR